MAAVKIPQELARKLKELEERDALWMHGADEVNAPMIRIFCEMAEDGNPVYWDEEFAQKTKFGGIISPPAMVITWCHYRYWKPAWMSQKYVVTGPGELAAVDVAEVHGWAPFVEAGYDEGIDVGGENYYYRPIYPGDRLSWRTRVSDIRQRPALRLGEGFEFWVGGEVFNQRGERVSYNSLRQLRFKSNPRIDSATYTRKIHPAVNLEVKPMERDPFETRSWNDVQIGEDLPPIALRWTWLRMMWGSANTRDWYPWHHNQDYARRGGKRDIFINQMSIESQYCRLITDWAGPEAEMRHLKFDIFRSTCTGDTTITGGRVLRKYKAQNPETKEVEALVDVHIEMFNTTEDCLAGRGKATVALPKYEILTRASNAPARP